MAKSKTDKAKDEQPTRKRNRGLDIMIEELDGSLWAAAVDHGRLQGLEVDPANEAVRWGAIYWAKVARIDASQDAAFIALDGVNIGILYNRDVRIKNKNGTWKRGGDVAIGKVLRPGQMIAVQAKTGYLPKDPKSERPGDKNPRVTMDVVLAGRYLIYAPSEKENKVSGRIRDKALRKQLMGMVNGIEGVEGCILRSAAADTQTDILLREARILKVTWEQLSGYFTGEEPTLIMAGPDAVQRMLSDNAGRHIAQIAVGSIEHGQHAQEWCDVFAPDLVTRIEALNPDAAGQGLFAYRDLVPQIEELFQPYIILKEGGSLIIQDTAALTAIDVNSGADKRSHLAVNLEAAVEVARQLRLRNLGGAIMIDFIRLSDKEDYKILLKALDDAIIAHDPCTVQIHGLTPTGFVELTRQRRTPALLERFQSTVN